MTKSYPTKRVEKVLRGYGLKRQAKGDGTDHEIWCDEKGRRVRPKMCWSEVAYPHLYCLGDQLEAQRICSRTEFLLAVKGR